MGDNLSKERRNTLAFCLEGEKEEEEYDTCGCGYPNVILLGMLLILET
jgi:hypothetical protein